jgi:predicted ferric reductase
MIADSSSFPGPTYYQFLRYFANRVGTLSFANTPLLISLAGRNNILTSLTGWSFDTFQRYHRWVARIVLLEATAHVIAYTLYTVLPGNTQSKPSDPDVREFGSPGSLFPSVASGILVIWSIGIFFL